MATNIENRVIFWIDLWEDLISNFLKKSYGLSLYSPHILVEDIITEIEENSFKNTENKKYFYSKLSYYFENDLIIKNFFYSDFKILRSTFNTERVNYIHETSKKIKKQFHEGLYFDFCLANLTEHLNTDEEITIDFINSINYLTQNIIVELIKKGYALLDIKKFARNIFDNYLIGENGNFLSTNFPHKINRNDYKDNGGVTDWEKFHSDIIDFITKLKNEDRIKALSYYFYKKKEKVNYIFIVQGLKGSIDIEIGGITFYSLDKKRFITKRSYEEEDLQKSGNKNSGKFIQAAVEIEYLLPESSLINALTKTENALDLISCYATTKTEIEIDPSTYIIEKDGICIFSTFNQNKQDSSYKYQESIDLNLYEEHLSKLNDYSFLWNTENLNQKVKSKLLNAIHWYSKAEQSKRQEDKMLNYWISIENLFNLEFDITNDISSNKNRKTKIHLIQEIISSVQIFKFVYDYGWELYHRYSSVVNNQSDNSCFLPEEIIVKANLSPKVGDRIYLEKFINCLSEIKIYEKDLFMLQKIEDVMKFYNKPSFSKTNIDEQIRLIESDILMIYRFRNLIVHNAHFDNALLPYFVWKIRDYSSRLIKELISECSKNDLEFSNDDKALSNLMIRLFLKREHFLLDLERGKGNLFNR